VRRRVKRRRRNLTAGEERERERVEKRKSTKEVPQRVRYSHFTPRHFEQYFFGAPAWHCTHTIAGILKTGEGERGGEEVGR